MIEFTRWLIFIKIVLQAVKKLKKIVIKKIVIKKTVIKKIVIKKIVMVENVLWQWKCLVVMKMYCSNENISW